MKKYLIFTGILSFAILANAQNPLEELDFYQKQAQNTAKAVQQELVNGLQRWLCENPSLPEANKALLLKANAQKELKAYPDYVITLLRYKYEFGLSEKSNIQKILKDMAQEFSRNEQDAYTELIQTHVPQADLPERLDTFLTLATKANLKGTYQPLVKEYNSFFKRFKNYEDYDRLELMFGDLHRNNKNPYAALMQYEKVWSIYPDTRYKAASLRMQGDVYASELKDYSKAQAIYEKVLNDFPDSLEKPTAYYHLALMEESQKQYNQALNHLGFAAKLYKEQGDKDSLFDVLTFKADIQEKNLKDYEGAANTLKQISSLFKNDENKYTQTQFKLADIYSSKLKDKTLQRQAYEEFVRTYPNSTQADKALFEAAALARDTGDYEIAKKYLERIIVDNPASPYANRAQRQLNGINKKIAKNN